MARAEYIIGDGRAPYWCSALLTPYARLDGKIGYEFRGAYMDYDLSQGDKLVLDERGRIKVVKQKGVWR